MASFLKQAIKLEYNDVFLYNKEKQMGGLPEKVKGVFEALGNQETEHLDILSVELKKYAQEQTIELAPPVGEKNLREILFYHKGLEESTIRFYSEFEKLCKDEEFKKKLSKIIVSEKTHLELINKLLKELP